MTLIDYTYSSHSRPVIASIDKLTSSVIDTLDIYLLPSNLPRPTAQATGLTIKELEEKAIDSEIKEEELGPSSIQIPSKLPLINNSINNIY